VPCSCGVGPRTRTIARSPEAQHLLEHMDYEEQNIIPHLPAAEQRHILNEHKLFRYALNQGMMPNPLDLEAHAAHERVAYAAAGMTHKEL